MPALPRADRLYLTRVHAAVEGDARLPPIDWDEWREVGRERHAADSDNPYEYSFLVYERAAHAEPGVNRAVLPRD